MIASLPLIIAALLYDGLLYNNFGIQLFVGSGSVMLIAGLFERAFGPHRQSTEERNGESTSSSALPFAPIEHMPMGVVVVDNIYCVEHFNQRANNFFPHQTLQQGTALPRAFADRLPPNDDTTTLSWPDVNPATIEATVRHVHHETGSYRVITLRDISDTERAEAALEKKDSLLQAILETSVAAVAVVNEQGDITYANKHAESILGLRRNASNAWSYKQLGWTLSPLDDEAPPTRTPLRDVLDTGHPIRDMRCVITWPDETRKYLSINAAPLPEAEDRPPQVVFSVEDITERHQTQQRLIHERRFSEAAINSLPGIFYMVDREGRYHRWNQSLERVTGYSAEELSEKALADLFDENDRSRIQQAVANVFPERNGFSVEANVITKDGSSIPHMFSGVPLTIDDTDYLVGVGMDVTRQKKREADLQEARHKAETALQEAERMNELKSSFLANMSHEMRTPLTTLTGYAQVLVDEDDPPPHFANRIADGALRLLNTFDAILTFSQIETNSYTLSPSKLSVWPCIQDVVREVASQTERTIQTDLPDAPCQAHLDASAVERIVKHLVDNAAKFSSPDDTVHVRARFSDVAFKIVVEDTGIGMPESFVPNAFDAFTQASSGNQRTQDGSGLGLAIVHGLTDAMEGSVTLDTEEGEGTTVTVRLPRRLSSPSNA